MIRSELVQLLGKDYPDLSTREIEKIVTVFFDEISGRLADGGRVELRGFGAFSTRARDARAPERVTRPSGPGDSLARAG